MDARFRISGYYRSCLEEATEVNPEMDTLVVSVPGGFLNITYTEFLNFEG